MPFVPIVLVVLGAPGVHDEAVVPVVHVVLVVRGAFGMQDEPVVFVVLVVLAALGMRTIPHRDRLAAKGACGGQRKPGRGLAEVGWQTCIN